MWLTLPSISGPPDRLGPEHSRQYQLYLVQERPLSWSRVIQMVRALRFFYRVTLKQPWMIEFLPHPKRPQTLPTLLSPAEVAALLQAPRELTSQAILTTLSAAGLRVSDLGHRHVPDVDSACMVLRIRQGKGQKDRSVMLAPQLLSLLRAYWRQVQPRLWLFPGADPAQPLRRKTVSLICRRAGVRAP